MPKPAKVLPRSTLTVSVAIAAAGWLFATQPTAAVAAPMSRPAASRLLFGDEFNGPAGSLPDPAKWRIDTGYWNAGSKQLECYTRSPDNLHLDGRGHLIITAMYAPNTACGTTTLNYTSGRLDTNKKFSAQYGTIEIRAEMPTAQGMWPAFWAVGDNSSTVGDPNGGEIDIMEALGSDTGTRKVYGTLHGPYAGSTSTFWSAGGTTTASSDLSAYHVYAISWGPGTISFQVDGVTYYTASQSSLSPSAQWMFDSQPFYMILNLAVGGNWPGNPDAGTVFPQTMTVDWVRVYSQG